MANVPRVRFCATIYPGLVKLISVTEKSDGTLIVNINSPRYYEKNFFEQSVGKEHRFTIHTSSLSNGHTITQTVGFKDGHTKRNANFVLRKNAKFIAHVFSSRWAFLGFPDFLAAPKPRDKVINLCTFDENLSTLITHVFVCTRGLGREISKISGGEFHSFDKFDLFVAPYFLKCAPFPDGDTAYWLSSIEGNHAPDDPNQRQALESLDIIHVPMAVDQMNNLLRERLIERMKQFLKVIEDPGRIELIQDHISRKYGFLDAHPFPFVPGNS